MKDFDREFEENAKKVLQDPNYSKYLDFGTDEKNNKIGSAMSILAQDIERECTMTAIKVFKKNEYDVGTIIHDGFLVQSLNVGDDVLRKAETEIRKKIGYDLQLEKKDLCNFDKKELWDDELSDVCEDTEETEEGEICAAFKNGRASHNLFARLFKIGFRNKLVYSGGHWYKLNQGGIFRKLEEDAEVTIGKDMKQFCGDFLLRLVKETTDDDKRKHLFQALAQLENHKYKVNCILASREEFHEPNLADKLDQNQNLLGFENGVYDLETLQFRTGTISDMVSKSVGYDFVESGEADIQVFEDLISEYFSDQSTIRWFKKHLGSLICGGNPEEWAYFWTGFGRNGKGTLEGLLRPALGEYYKIINREFYTDRRKGSGPQPEILDLRNARVGMTAETEGDTKFVLGAFKGLTGNDTLKARALYSNKEIEFTAKHKTIIQTNHLPQFTGSDNGVLARVKSIVFEYQFLGQDSYDGNNPQHKKVDIHLKHKLEKYGKSFIHFLIKWYKVYKNEGLADLPQAIIESTNEYRAEIDTVGTFIKMALIHTGDEKDMIQCAELRTRYNEWATMNHMDESTFGKRLRSAGIAPKRKGRDRHNTILGYIYDMDYIREANRMAGFGADF
jgi:putative DNA primase/helicase